MLNESEQPSLVKISGYIIVTPAQQAQLKPYTGPFRYFCPHSLVYIRYNLHAHSKSTGHAYMKNSGEGCPLPETASLTRTLLKEKVKKKNQPNKND